MTVTTTEVTRIMLSVPNIYFTHFLSYVSKTIFLLHRLNTRLNRRANFETVFNLVAELVNNNNRKNQRIGLVFFLPF